ncbi:MAG: hypothetical protein HGB32_03010 [Geobacteraceae bacterium]|nr:hypothetical protein [Geobacteraceae bacterium]NTW79103.1 hypothetical protein [Geobacteraceae bacterium]
MSFSNYPAERLRIESIASRLNEREAMVRDRLMDALINKRRPVGLSELTAEGLILPELSKVIKKLEDKRAIVRDEDENICFAYPVSALPTVHRVTLADRRVFHAMCAVDAMGAAFTFRQDVRISSRCSECRHPVEVEIRDGRLSAFSPPELHVLHVDLNRNDNWAGNC